MMRPRISPHVRGFKPQLVADLLGVGKQTLRYWRNAQLEPHAQSSYFSGGRLLAYRILKVLIRHHFISIEVLQRCDVASLFECCEQVTMSVLALSFLYVDPVAGLLQLHEQCPSISERNFDALVVPLKGIVAAHREVLERVGHNPSLPQRHTLQPSGLSVVSTHH